MAYDIAAEIQELKKKKNAIILAHYYQDGEIQDVADYIGDSFYLAKMGQSSKAETILMAGVVFMGESVKILNPQSRVLVPDLNAGCSLVQESPFQKYLEWRRQNPKGIAVTYINSSAEVKAISDVIVTSSNAAQIVKSIPADRPILFGPDANLGRYLARELKREMILWPGSCEVHVLFSARKLYELVKKHPDALVIAHPECDENVLQYASVIGSTSKLLEVVQTSSSHRKFIVATETGIFHQMRKARPDVELIQAPTEDETCLCNDCPYMKLSSLEKIHKALSSGQPELKLNESLRERAQVSLDRMLKISAGQNVSWPERFADPDWI